MKRFVRWLADTGHRIRLFAGDNRHDDGVVQEILADLRSYRPDLESTWFAGDPVTSLADLMREIAPVGTVVAIRYHNVMCALKLSKPTLSLSYAPKHDVLMAGMGLPSSACLPARPPAGRRRADRAVHGARGPVRGAAEDRGGA